MAKKNLSTHLFTQTFPNIAAWVEGQGRIEIGPDGFTDVFIRALDEGGVIWESDAEYEGLDDALLDLESGLGKWIEENG
jgi:hypothetical protein